MIKPIRPDIKKLQRLLKNFDLKTKGNNKKPVSKIVRTPRKRQIKKRELKIFTRVQYAGVLPTHQFGIMTKRTEQTKGKQ